MLKFNELKQNRAITLVALILTIIVMLILVGVSISVLINSDLIGTAQNAGERTETAYGQEGSMGQITVGNTTYDSIEDYLNNKPVPNIKIKLSMTNNPVTPTVTNGNTIYTDKNGKKAVIPAGFTVSGVSNEQTVDGGLVIYDIPEGETVDWTNTSINMQESYNQFVWVPVLQNQTLKIEVESKEEITAIEIKDELLTEITKDVNNNTLAPSGTQYSVEVKPTINGTYTVAVTAGEETITETLDVTSLYAQDYLIYEKIPALKAQIESMVDEENGITLEMVLAEIGLNSIDELPAVAVAEMEELSDSTVATYSNCVNTYGGYYIARYEAGHAGYTDENGVTTGRTSSSTDYPAPLSKKNQYPYNYISQEKAIEVSEAMYSATTTPSITPTLTNAAAWDRTLNWLVETKAVTQAEVATDSTSWGNYENSEFKFTGKYSTNGGDSYTEATTLTDKIKYETSNKYYLLGTGITDYTKRNNIYDIAGNCSEWTTEAHSSGDVVRRGGLYNVDGSDSPASVRSIFRSDYSDSNYLLRVTLYIN